MDVQRAKELLTVLADGVDPLTGEVLPDDHVCNKGEIVRALHCAVEELSRRRKKPLPENNGKPWTEELDDELCRLFDGGMKKKDLCVAAGISHASMAKLGKNENVTTDVLVKICTALQCDIGDIMELTNNIDE